MTAKLAEVIVVVVRPAESGVPSRVSAEEEAAISAMRRGDTSSLDWLHETYRRKAMLRALDVTRNLAVAEDAVSVAMITAFYRIERLKPDRPFWPWFRTIVTRQALRSCRQKEVMGPDYEFTLSLQQAPEWSDPAASLERSDLRRVIQELLNQLNPNERTALLLRYEDDLDERRVASVMGVSLNNVKSYLHRGRIRLRLLLLEIDRSGAYEVPHALGRTV